MASHEDFYRGFNGYNAYPLREAEKIIRERLTSRCDKLIEEIDGCYEKSRESGRLKIASNIEAVRKRLIKLKKDIEEKEATYISPYVKEGISKVDEKRITEVDLAIVDILDECLESVTVLSCNEEDMHIIDRFTGMNSRIRQLEEKCHERMKILLTS